MLTPPAPTGVTKTAPPKEARGHFNLATTAWSKPETGAAGGSGPCAHGLRSGAVPATGSPRSDRVTSECERLVGAQRCASGQSEQPTPRGGGDQPTDVPLPTASAVYRTICSRIIPWHVRSLAVVLFSRAVVMDASGGQAP